MSDPQLPPPIPQTPQPPLAPPVAPPAPPYAAPMPPHGAPPAHFGAPVAPPVPPTYAPPPGAYLSPAQGYQQPTGPYAPPTAQAKSPWPGTLALILALFVTIIPGVIAWVTGYGIGAGIDDSRLDLIVNDDLSFLSPVRPFVLWAEITFWVGGVLGVWALVQGIVAVSKGRGRGRGVWAIILSLLAPLIFFTVGTLAFFAGLTTLLQF